MCTKKIGTYQMDLSNKLGRGAYGDVYLGQDLRSGLLIAIKQISLPHKNERETEKALTMAKNEITVMKAIQDKNVVKFVDMVRTQNNLYLMIEFCNGGSLDHYISRKCNPGDKYLAEKEARIIMKQIVQGYKALHSCNIVHRDLKPANILIHDGVVKIADFGFSKFLEKTDEQLLYTYAGSPLYMAPQILQQKQYTSKADVWSLGIIFYEILFGTLPWHATAIQDLIVKIQNEPLNIPDLPLVSQGMKSLIREMLQREESDRISWKDLYAHRYFNETIEQEYLIQLRNSFNGLEEETDELKKSNAKKTLYFQEQNVVQHVYHAQEIQQQLSNACPGIIEIKQDLKQEQNKQLNLEQMFKIQKDKVEIQSLMQSISDWIVHRKNKSAFLSSINSQLFDHFQENLSQMSPQLFWGFLFMLTKYQTSILFKMKCRIQSGRLDNNNKFTPEEWKKFCKSKEGQTSLKVIEHDFQVINQYWDSLIPETIKHLKGTQDPLLKSILSVCNKNQIEKQVFDVIFKGAVVVILDAVKQRIHFMNKQTPKQLLQFGQHLQNCLYMSRIFKFKGPEQIDFFKYYQKVENLTMQQILHNLNLL